MVNINTKRFQNINTVEYLQLEHDAHLRQSDHVLLRVSKPVYVVFISNNNELTPSLFFVAQAACIHKHLEYFLPSWLITEDAASRLIGKERFVFERKLKLASDKLSSLDTPATTNQFTSRLTPWKYEL